MTKKLYCFGNKDSQFQSITFPKKDEGARHCVLWTWIDIGSGYKNEGTNKETSFFVLYFLLGI